MDMRGCVGSVVVGVHRSGRCGLMSTESAGGKGEACTSGSSAGPHVKEDSVQMRLSAQTHRW